MQGLTACQGSLSLVDPAGPAARDIAGVWWLMLAYAVASLLCVMALWWYAWRKPQGPADGSQEQRVTNAWIVGGGIVWPLLSVTALLAIGIPVGHRIQALPIVGGDQPMKVEVLARQWSWEVRYPGSARVLVNEMKLPAGQPVDVHVSTADVIHSFWVPRLQGKIDAIPGRVNVIRLHADEPGQHRGQCAEFCGLGHAHMSMTVQVMPATEFTSWLKGRSDDD